MLTKYEQKPFCVGGPVMTFGVQPVKQTEWDERAVEHRPYPTTPLYLNSTLRALAFTKFQKYRVQESKQYGSVICGGTTLKYPISFYTRIAHDVPNLNYSLSAAEVTQEMRNQVKDRFVNLADCIGEYREAVTMVAKPIAAVGEVVKDLWRARKATNGQKHLRFGGNKYRRKATLYQQMQLIPATVLLSDFGLRPSIDIVDDVVSRWNARVSQPFIVKVGCTRSADAVQVISGLYDGMQRTEGTRWMSGRGYVQLTSVRDKQLETGNILEAIWAGIPFSFLVDRFVRVGDWLSSFDALEGTNFLGGTLTTRERYVVHDSRVNAKNTASVTYTNHHEGLGTFKSHSRSVIGSLAIGRPYYRPNRHVGILRDLVSILAISIAGRKVEGLLDLARRSR